MSLGGVLNQSFISYPNYMNIVLIAANQVLAERLQLLCIEKDEAQGFFVLFIRHRFIKMKQRVDLRKKGPHY